MKKDELIKLIDSLELPKGEYYILSSSCLVLYGLRDKANDLDLVGAIYPKDIKVVSPAEVVVGILTTM